MRFSVSLLVGFSLLFIAILPAQGQASRTVEQTVSMRPGGTVVLNGYGGRIDVSPWDRPEVRVEARVEDEDDALVKRTQIQVEGGGTGRVEISEEVEEENGGFLSSLFGGDNEHPSAVYYTLRVPREANLELNTYSSDVRAQSLGGALSVNTYSGNAEVTFERLAGEVSFNSYSGNATMHLPRGAGFRLEANLGMGGNFEPGFAEGAFSAIGGSVYKGAVSGGGSRVSFNTFSGTLRLAQSQ